MTTKSDIHRLALSLANKSPLEAVELLAVMAEAVEDFIPRENREARVELSTASLALARCGRALARRGHNVV